MLKKTAFALSLASSVLFGADHDLYHYSLSGSVGYLFASNDFRDGSLFQISFQENLPTEEVYNLGAWKVLYGYSRGSSLVEGDLLWYIDNQSPWTPYVGIGAGMIFPEDFSSRGYLSGVLGGEYQIRGDLAGLGEFKYLYDSKGKSQSAISFGLKYSFGI